LPSAPATPSPFSSHLCFIPTPIPPPKHTQPIYMLTCLLVELQTASHGAVNFNKLREIIQHPTENPTDFLGCLTETLTHYTLS
jgi:hypothetical protein